MSGQRLTPRQAELERELWVEFLASRYCDPDRAARPSLEDIAAVLGLSRDTVTRRLDKYHVPIHPRGG